MTKHTLVALVEDKPGVLNRVASLFRRRAFNIASLTVGHSEQPHLSRMTIVVDAGATAVPLIEANLAKLIHVVDVQDVTHQDTLTRDLVLIKVRAGAAARAEIAQLAGIFRARIVDVGPESVIVEATGDGDKLDGLVEMLRPHGILEMVRTGCVAMVRGYAPVAAPAPHRNGHDHTNGHEAHESAGASSV
jgi:acetolactate synthase-1/3 small subunit